MRFKIMVLTIAVAFVCANSVLATGGSYHEQGKTAIKVGNTTCPVSGENVKAMGGGIEHEYNGKIYNLCCPGCVGIFQKDPGKYSKIGEENVEMEQ